MVVGFLVGSGLGPRRRRAVKCSVAQDVAVSVGDGKSVAKKDVSISTYPQSPVTDVLAMAVESSSWTCVAQHFQRNAKFDGLSMIDEHHGDPVRWTHKEVYEQICMFAAALEELGVKKGDVVSIFSESSARATVADAGILFIGGASAARGGNAPIDELKYIYEHSESVGLVVESRKILTKMLEVLPREKVKFVVLLCGDLPEEAFESGIKCYTFAEVTEMGRENAQPETREIKSERDGLAAMLYTSGTTGQPKGVPLTHANLLHQVKHVSIGSADPCPGETFLSILPVWHIFERTGQHFFSARRAAIAFTNTKSLRNDLKKHRPEFLVGVPRVFDVIYSGIMNKMEKESMLKKAIFFLFYWISKKRVLARRIVHGYAKTKESPPLMKKVLSLIAMVLLTPLDLLAQVWKKIREGLGGRHKGSICGGGALASHIEDFYEAAGLDVYVGYGMTETSPVICNRNSEQNVRGSVGLPITNCDVKVVDVESGVEVKRGEQGLVLARGPQVTAGYYKNEEANKKSFRDGYIDTGDLGWWSSTGDLVISGRQKDVIVLSNGENIEPEIIEATITESPAIDQVMLVGQDERHLGALIVPSVEFLNSRGWANQEQVRYMLEEQKQEQLRRLEEELEQNPDLKSYYDDELSVRVRQRPGYRPEERVAKWKLILEGFTQENEMMTQTLKVKRPVVCNAYEKEIAGLFSH